MKNAFLVAALLCASVSVAAAQPPTIGPGKLELGVFPLGGTFLVGGDDNKEVDFNVYSFGANLSYYLTERAAVEWELGIGLGLAQDVVFNNRTVSHAQIPHIWSYSPDVAVF